MMISRPSSSSPSFASAHQQGLNLPYKQRYSQGLLFRRGNAKISASTQKGKLVSCDSRSKVESLTKCSSSNQKSGHADAFGEESTISLPKKIAKQLDVFIRFARPYPNYGTIAGIISVSLLSLETIADVSPAFFIGVVKAIIPAVLANIYTSGINHLSDIEIDRINKPHFPLASGEYSIAVGSTITTLSALSSVLIAMMSNSTPLLIAITTMLSFGTAYSVDLPFLRWKKNIFLTSLFMIVRWTIVPTLFFAHSQNSILGRPLVFTKPIIFAAVFMTIMALTIGIIKDLPDVKGDKAFGLQPPSVIYGRKKVFWSCVYVLLATYGGAAVFEATSPFIPNKIITVMGHVILAIILWRRAKFVNTSDASETFSFYLFIWKLLYSEYLLILFVR